MRRTSTRNYRQWGYIGFNGDGSDTLRVPHGEPYAGNLHVRFDEGADVPHGASRSTLLPKGLGGKLGENRRRIIRMMVQNPSVTTFDLVSGIGISQTAIENNITWLRAHGYVGRVGPDKGGHWEVVER